MRVLVSYHFKQMAVARRVIEELVARGMEAESNDLRLSCHKKSNFLAHMLNVLRTYDVVIVLWSKDYVKDEWLQDELFAIQTLQTEREAKFIYPVVIDKTALTGPLHRLGAVILYNRLADGLNELVTSIPDNKKLFIVMKFGDEELNSTYSTIIRPVAKSFGYDVLRIDEREKSDSVSYNILKQIEGAGVVISELTGARPNVYFETGYALALRKELILTARKGEVVHFDLADRGIIFWNNPANLKDLLERRFEALVGSRAASLP